MLYGAASLRIDNGVALGVVEGDVIGISSQCFGLVEARVAR